MAAPWATTMSAAEWASTALPNQHRGNLVTGKRKADDDLESPSSISSHFKKLRLNHAAAAAAAAAAAGHLQPPATVLPRSPPPIREPTSPTASLFRPHIANTDARPALVPHLHRPDPSTLKHRPPRVSDEEFMTVDDTPHRIIIHDLESEIAQIEADEAEQAARSGAPQIILPEDLDKTVSGIPQRLLHTDTTPVASPPENLNTALILYKDPASISVPEEEDVVRKTIIEARRRAREKQADEQKRQQREAETESLRLRQPPRLRGLLSTFHSQDRDDDAMTDNSSHGERDDDFDPMDIE